MDQTLIFKGKIVAEDYVSLCIGISIILMSPVLAFFPPVILLAIVFAIVGYGITRTTIKKMTLLGKMHIKAGERFFEFQNGTDEVKKFTYEQLTVRANLNDGDINVYLSEAYGKLTQLNLPPILSYDSTQLLYDFLISKRVKIIR